MWKTIESKIKKGPSPSSIWMTFICTCRNSKCSNESPSYQIDLIEWPANALKSSNKLLPKKMLLVNFTSVNKFVESSTSKVLYTRPISLRKFIVPCILLSFQVWNPGANSIRLLFQDWLQKSHNRQAQPKNTQIQNQKKIKVFFFFMNVPNYSFSFEIRHFPLLSCSPSHCIVPDPYLHSHFSKL